MVIVAALLLLVFHVGPRTWALALLTAAIVFELAEKTLLVRYTRRIPVAAGAEAMIGRPVTVVSECRPAGRVRFGVESWKARCTEGAGVGERLLVDSVESVTLIVSKPSRRKSPGT
jgi:membrane protein implicated in regulation of membrane protease activity